jgi:hypothetical protein
VKKKCEHLAVDAWHVATQEGREMVRLPAGRRYGWRDQVRAETAGRLTRWMWPGLLGLVTLGIIIGDWWLILGASAALLFFVYQAATLVRALGAGEVVMATSCELTTARADGKEPVSRAVTTIRGRRCEVIVSCPLCIDTLRAKKRLDLAVLVDPSDTGNNWLVGFREG